MNTVTIKQNKNFKSIAILEKSLLQNCKFIKAAKGHLEKLP